MTNAQYDELLRKLRLARSEIDATQGSVDDLPAGANANEALETIAGALWDASEILEFYEETNELPEECRAVMLDLLRGLHHMVLVVKFRGS
jgi:hypothetical protein